MKHRRDADHGAAPQPSQPAKPAGAGDEDVRSLLERVSEGYARLEQVLQDVSGQSAMLRQQSGQMYEAVRQLYGAVSAQCVQLRDSDLALLDELQKFQTGGPQRAMAGVFYKLFRDLLKHMNQLDELVRQGDRGAQGEAERPWMAATRVARDGLESILRDWGCVPLAIKEGEDEFDPEVHEAVPDGGRAGVSSSDGNRVVSVVRRGWQLSGVLLQHPQVIVN